MVANLLVHLEHVNPGLLENSLHFGVAANLSFVGRILKIVGFDMFPESLDNLRARELHLPVSLAGYCVSNGVSKGINPGQAMLTWVSPQISESVELRLKGFWKPPTALRFLTPESALPLTSLSSSSRTFLALFFRGAFRFFTVRSPPPRVVRPRARLFS